MSNISRWILACPILLALHSSVLAQSATPPVPPLAWPVNTAPARLVSEVSKDVSHPVLASISLYVPNPQWLTMPIRVFTETGIPVGSDLLWTAPGQPATLLIDTTSNVTHYQIYVGSNWPPMHLPDTKAGAWLEIRAGDGKVINNLPDMLQSWNQSKTVLGRAIMTGLFEGGNRFGTQGNLLAHVKGWFEVAAPEHLQFADVSVDASFVLVDGKEVVEWPGIHERWWHYGAPPQGAVDLAPGIHSVDYYNAYVASPDAQPPFTFALAVKGGAFSDWTMLTSDSKFFRPVAFGSPGQYNLQVAAPHDSASGAVPAVAFNWTNLNQSIIDTEVANIGFIDMRFWRLEPQTGTVTWTFDDGTTAQGQMVSHLFPRPGLRTAHVSVKDPSGKEVASLTQTISIHPDWNVPNKHPELRAEQEADIISRDPSTFSAPDLASCFAVFSTYQQADDLLKFLPAVCAKMNAIDAADLPYIKNAAVFLVHDDWAHSADEIKLLHALIDRADQDKARATPPLIAIGSECRLALARVLARTDHLDEVKSAVAAINAPSLANDEPRQLAILQADLALASGDVAGAKKQYQALTGEPTGPEVRSSIRRTAKIGQARAFIDRKDFDAAEDSLNEVAWQAPIEKLSPDWALTRLHLYQEENLPVEAYTWARQLLPVITGSGRSELLFRLTDLAFAEGDNNLAQKTLTELLQKHPYSEEAAQAKEKWPGKS